MSKSENKTATQIAAERLRRIVLTAEEGALIGSEEALIARLGCARSTVRQVARLLEREGLLRVRRGINGGYFGTRPDAGTIESTVSTYLETLDIRAEDVTVVASTLWVEAVRRAALADADLRRDATNSLQELFKSVEDTASFDKVRDIELESQGKIFNLANSNYVKLIFDINVAYSRRWTLTAVQDNDSSNHREFVRAWRDAKLMELSAIASGDHELAVLAAQHSRKIWHRRVWSRYSRPADQRDEGILPL